MEKQFITKKIHRYNKKKEYLSKKNKKLKDFQNEKELIADEIKTIEEEIFEHLKKHTRKVLDSKK
ncbi:MAG: hypothetical protein QXL18_01520 [Candidatus Woesearchaeota archaeon]